MNRPLALAIGFAAVVVGLLTEHVASNWLTQPAWIPGADLAIGWSMVAAGLVASVARPGQPAGPRLVLAGFLWFVGTPTPADAPVLSSLAFAFQGYYDLVLVLIALSFPARWPGRTGERAMLSLMAGVYLTESLIRLAARSSAFVGVDLLPPDRALPFVAWSDIASAAVTAVAGILIVRRWLLASPPARRLIGPVVAAGAASAFAAGYVAYYPLSLLGYLPTLPEDFAVPIAWIFNLVRVVIPIAMLAGILRQQATRSAVVSVIADVSAAPSTADLERALALSLGDPSLRVLAWDDATGDYVDASGARAAVPPPGLAATPVAAAGAPLGMLVHDPALAADPALVEAGVAVTRLVILNERLSREVRAQLSEVLDSRARIVEAGEAERRRIERDLHDGVQQRLVALALGLRRAEGRAAQDAAADALRHGADEALAVVEDVRELARGIHPAVLGEAGLGTALRALADRAPMPVELSLDLHGRGGETAIATAYFVASEALANAAKHADASRTLVDASDADGQLRLRIEDDGRGGADADGSGLRGLADRVAAIGGTFAVESPAAGGTVVSAAIPIS